VLLQTPPQPQTAQSGSEPATTPLPRVAITTGAGDASVEVEVVSSPAKVEKGLMFREYLGADAGMLFLMGKDYDWAFYMRNTLIPLDMIFITKDLTVAGVVANATPRTETLRQVGKPSRYVLEVNAGWATAHQVAEGAKVRFDGVKGL
jgi:uncharacterized membrane protein (UPF0127 family)